jgi:hypothetical protein
LIGFGPTLCQQAHSDHEDKSEKEAPKANTKQKTTLERVTLEANILKKEYHQSMSSCSALIGQIENSEGWAWAKNDENLGKLKGLHSQALCLTRTCPDAAVSLCVFRCNLQILSSREAM